MGRGPGADRLGSGRVREARADGWHGVVELRGTARSRVSTGVPGRAEWRPPLRGGDRGAGRRRRERRLSGAALQRRRREQGVCREQRGGGQDHRRRAGERRERGSLRGGHAGRDFARAGGGRRDVRGAGRRLRDARRQVRVRLVADGLRGHRAGFERAGARPGRGERDAVPGARRGRSARRAADGRGAGDQAGRRRSLRWSRLRRRRGAAGVGPCDKSSPFPIGGRGHNRGDREGRGRDFLRGRHVQGARAEGQRGEPRAGQLRRSNRGVRRADGRRGDGEVEAALQREREPANPRPRARRREPGHRGIAG